MKKGMKKIAALFVAVVMMFSMGFTTFAANPEGTHKITVNGGDNSLEGITFNAYKLFDITGTGADGKYGYTPDSNFESWLTEQAKSDSNASSVYDYVNTQMSQASTAQTFLAELKTEITDSSVAATATVTGTKGQTGVELTGLVPGYYVIYQNAEKATYSPMAVNVANTDVTVYVKSSEPGIDKEAGENGKDWTDAQIGTKVPFKVTVQIPNTEGMDMSTYVFRVKDTMSSGLTFNEGDVIIKIGETELTNGIDYTVMQEPVSDPNGTKVTFDFVIEKKLSQNLLNNVGKNMTISYTATLNENAVVENQETNDASLEYTNQSGTIVEGDEAPTDNTTVYTYQYDFLKKAENEKGNVLSGAEFEVYKENKTDKVNFVKADAADTTKGYRVATSGETEYATLVTDNNGKLHIYGLEAGTYYLKETKAPDGYNKLKDMIEFKITNNENGAQAGTKEMTVINKSGSLLPGTGGTGSIVFAVVGGLVVLGGAFVLIKNRKRPEA